MPGGQLRHPQYLFPRLFELSALPRQQEGCKGKCMASGFNFEEMTPGEHTLLQLSFHWLRCSLTGTPSCKGVWEMQSSVGPSSAYLKHRSSITKGKSKRVDTGDKLLPLSQSVSSLVTSVVLLLRQWKY